MALVISIADKPAEANVNVATPPEVEVVYQRRIPAEGDAPAVTPGSQVGAGVMA